MRYKLLSSSHFLSAKAVEILLFLKLKLLECYFRLLQYSDLWCIILVHFAMIFVRYCVCFLSIWGYGCMDGHVILFSRSQCYVLCRLAKRDRSCYCVRNASMLRSGVWSSGKIPPRFNILFFLLSWFLFLVPHVRVSLYYFYFIGCHLWYVRGAGWVCVVSDMRKNLRCLFCLFSSCRFWFDVV